MLELICEQNRRTVFRRIIDSSPFTIGRAPDNIIRLLDEEISRHHCRIERHAGNWFVVDHSTNGTLVGGKRIKKIRVQIGEKITIGNWQLKIVEFKNMPGPATQIMDRPDIKTRLGGLIGESQKMRAIFSLLEKVAPTNSTVCITGESGTGKELVASEIHKLSSRCTSPFVAVNCGAVPAAIIESQLFGHERGAFTGATERTIGLFEQARGGTLFLDEIGEMQTDLQTRLLRILETRSVRRIGGKEEISVDVRLICATNRELKELVADGKFREDLFFRVFVVPIELPPLRGRIGDIPLLARFFADAHKRAARYKFTESAIRKLKEHSWPGNVRELRNVLERSFLLADSNIIDADDIKIDFAATARGAECLRENERVHIANAIRECAGNLSKVARRLGIARSTLQSKIEKYAIEVKKKG